MKPPTGKVEKSVGIDGEAVWSRAPHWDAPTLDVEAAAAVGKLIIGAHQVVVVMLATIGSDAGSAVAPVHVVAG